MDDYTPDQFSLTGATGALGFAFLQRFFSQNKTVRTRLLVRRTSASFQTAEFQNWLQANQERVTIIDADIRQLSDEALETLLSTDGGLWHFAALTSLTATDAQVAREIREINAQATARLVKAAIQQAKPNPFYHISTAYVVGEREGRILETENQVGQTFRNPYEAAKLEAELHLQRAFAAGVPGAIFRPSIVIGDETGAGGLKMVDACAYAVALAAKRGEPFVFRLKPTAKMNLVHCDWIIAALLDLARLPSGPRQTYHLTTPQSSSWLDIFALIQQMIPQLEASFQPDLERRALPSASKLFDKAATEVRPYFEADVTFDRTNTERDLSPKVSEVPMDLRAFVKRRLETELSGALSYEKV